MDERKTKHTYTHCRWFLHQQTKTNMNQELPAARGGRLACHPPCWDPTPFQLKQGANKSSLPFIWALQAAGGRQRGDSVGGGGCEWLQVGNFFFLKQPGPHPLTVMKYV